MKQAILLSMMLLLLMGFASAHTYEWDHGGVQRYNPTSTTYELRTWTYVNHDDYNRAVMDFYDDLDDIIESDVKLIEYRSNNDRYYNNNYRYNSRNNYQRSTYRYDIPSYNYDGRSYDHRYDRPRYDRQGSNGRSYNGGYSPYYKYNYNARNQRQYQQSYYYKDDFGRYQYRNGVKFYKY